MMSQTHTEWFRLQFGDRPTTITPISFKQKISELRAEANRLEDLRARAEIWDEQFRASRYVWNVAQDGKIKRIKVG